MFFKSNTIGEQLGGANNNACLVNWRHFGGTKGLKLDLLHELKILEMLGRCVNRTKNRTGFVLGLIASARVEETYLYHEERYLSSRNGKEEKKHAWIFSTWLWVRSMDVCSDNLAVGCARWRWRHIIVNAVLVWRKKLKVRKSEIK